MPFPSSIAHGTSMGAPASPIYLPSPSYSNAPDLIVDLFDAENNVLDQNGVAHTATCFQNGDWDPAHGKSGLGQVICYPYARPQKPYGTILVYDPGSVYGFGDARSYTGINLRTLVNDLCYGFGGGFKDTLNNYVYLPPSRQISQGVFVTLGTGQHGLGYTPNVVNGALSVGAPTGSPSRQATVVASTNANGQVVSITVKDSGCGYTGVPALTFPSGTFGTPTTPATPAVSLGNVWAGNTLATRINLSLLNSDPLNTGGNTYQTHDLASIGLARNGWFFGMYNSGDGCCYLCPAEDNTLNVLNKNWVRYNTAGSFTANSSWKGYDLTQGVTSPSDIRSRACGMQSGISFGRYVYLVPFGLGYSIFVRYDTQGANGPDGTPFSNDANYSYVDLSLLQPGLTGAVRGFTGALVINNRYILLIPWKDNGLSTNGQDDVSQNNLTSSAVLYDTLGAGSNPFTNLSNYQVLDLLRVSNAWGQIAAGYEFGWLDAFGWAWFVPTGIYTPADHVCVPIVGWNTALPFTDPASWVAINDPGLLYNDGLNVTTALLPGGCGATYITPLDTALWWSLTTSSALQAQGNFSQGLITRIRYSR